MKKFQSTTLNAMSVAVLGFALILIINFSASAQSSTDGSTPLGLSPGAPAGSYSLSDFDSVNLYNGNLSFSLPIVKIAGRGGASYSMTARIEQKWLVDREFQGGGQPNLFTPNPNWWNTEGFIPIYSAGRMDVRQAGSYEESILGSCGYVHNQTLTRLTFTAPDGTEYELRDQLTNGQPKQPTSCDPGFNRGRIFVTADGTSATFTSDSDITDYNYDNPANIPPSGDLVMRDGTHYRIDGGVVSWMRDRNGNKLTFTYDINRRVTSIADSLNRQTTIAYGTQIPGYDQITLKGFGGATRTIKVYESYLQDALRSDCSLETFQQLFPELNGAYNTPANPPVVSAVELPNGEAYHLYYNSYGELARVVLPTGGAIEYDYAAGLTNGAASGVIPVANNFKAVYRRVIERRVYPDGGTGTGYASRMTYSRPETSTSNAGYVIADQYNSSGTLLNRSYHYFYGSARSSFNQQPTQYPGWKDGREYQTTTYAADGTTPLRQVTNTFAQRAAVSWWTGGADQEPPNDPRLIETDSTLMDTNQVSKQTFGYDDSVPFNNQNNVKEYDFGSGAPGALVRETQTTFVTSTSYTGTDVSLLSLPSQVSIYDAGGVERARTTFEFDNYTPDTNHAGLGSCSNLSGFDASFSTSYTTRGNVTATTRYLLINGSVSGSVTSFAQYDIAGNVLKTIDARGYATNFDYSDRFGSPDGEARSNSGATELAGQYSYAFPTLVTKAGFSAYTQFDYYLGRAVDSEDANGIISSGYYSDALDRPTQARRAVGTTIENQTTFSYDDVARSITATSDQTSNNDNALKSQVFYDAMGRKIESRQYEGGTNYIAVQTQYDALGRAYNISNPFRPWQSESALWTTTGFDALGRVISVTTPDSAVVNTSFSGNSVTVTDQTSIQRKSVSDALGRLTQVYEDPNGLNYLTSYSYDVLDDLTTVSQGSQTRTFVYDSLKRLSSTANPESGTISYQYDNNGNLTQKTDARGVVTTFAAYDALNRSTTRSYSDGTPSVTYAYDSATNGKGRLASVSSSVSTYSYSSYDALGRALSASQTLGSQTYSLSYSYDLAGHVTGMTYPSGRTVSYISDSAGRTSSVTGYLGDGSNRTYATGIIYSSFGGITKEQFGTSTAVYNKLFYDSRGQLSEIRDSTSYTGPTDTTWNRGAIINHYSNSCWGMCGGSNSTTSMTDNNGNLKKQEVYIPNDDQISSYDNYAQFYEYDSLNRLSSVRENKFGGAVNWQQAYTYDRWGNRTIDQTNTWGSGIPKPNFGVDTSTNRLTAPNGYTMNYDSAGNLTFDDSDGIGGTRTYDAENRMKQAWANSQWQTYTYDGHGHRVKRNVSGTETWQVYGIGGELLAEYATNASPSSPQKEYGYRNGQLLVTAEPSAQIHWLVTDQLGTPRMILDSSGSLGAVSRHDDLPFGEEIYAGVDGRLTTQGYTGDNVRQKFTQKERDIETQLDYFGERYYASTQGRFISVDPLGASAIVSDPQSFNRYTYVLNNPLKYVDPNGLDAKNPWADLTDEERKLLASKLTTVTGKDQMAAAQKAFNEKVTVLNKDGSVNEKLTGTNVASVQNFVGSLSGDNNVWSQIKSIDRVSSTGNGLQSDIGFSVENRDAFIHALTETKDASGYNRFVYMGPIDEKLGHPEGTRELGYGVTDPSMHIDSQGNGHLSAHWDPSSSLTKDTWKEAILDTVPGGIVRRAGAGVYHYTGRATTQAVRQYLKDQGLVPQH